MKLRYLLHAAILILLTLVAEPREIWDRNTLTDPGKIIPFSEASPIHSSKEAKCSQSNTNRLSFPKPDLTWQLYKDTDYGFAVEYPSGWKSQVTIYQAEPFTDPDAILKRITFTGAEGLIDLDTWFSHDRGLTSWLEWYSKTRYELPFLSPNAMVGGQLAVSFMEKGGSVDMLTTFIYGEKYVYRLWYTVSRNEVGLQAYKHMLDTFTFPQSKTAPAQLPQEVIQEALSSIGYSGVINPLVSSCCGYTSSGNPFGCCDNKGNCVWWVWYKYSVPIPFRGDAWKWWYQAPDYPDWGRRSTPRQNPGENIAWWDKSSSNNNLGHVAYVANYTGGDYVKITEMAYCTICYRARTILVTTPNGYIFLWKYPVP